MIFKKLKESIIEDFNEYLEVEKNNDAETVINDFLSCIEEHIDEDVLNHYDDEKEYGKMMGEILYEVPDLLVYSIGDLFDELNEHKEDCLAYVFSQALISYTIREVVLHFYNKNIFTEDMLTAVGVTKEFIESPDNPYRKENNSTIDDPEKIDLSNMHIDKKYLH